MKKVSIIIPVYNGQKYLAKTIESALNQTYNNYEIVIVDDGSTDDSKKIVDKYKAKNNNIKYIYQTNKGLGGARNTGIRNADSPLFANLDADDLYHPEFLEKTVRKLIKERAEAVAPNCNYFYQGKVLKDRTFFDINNTPNKINLINELKSNRIASTALIEKKSAINIGLYRRMNHLEDYDFWLRMLLASKKISTIKEPLFNYRIHKKSMSANKMGMAEAEIDLFSRIIDRADNKQVKKLAQKRLSDGYVSAGKYKKALKTKTSLKTIFFYLTSKISKKLPGKIIRLKKHQTDPKEKLLQ